MNIEWLSGWGWNTTAELTEDYETIMEERRIAIIYWYEGMR